MSTQSMLTKSPSEADSLECGGFVTLDNPLYDKEFEVILDGQTRQIPGETHPMAQTVLTAEVAEVKIDEIPTRFNAQQLALRSINKKAKDINNKILSRIHFSVAM